MSERDLAQAALAYARRGLRVHPVAADRKVALLEDWPNRATLDPTTIASWWRRWPQANVAIACGGEMRLLVVDIDPDAGGEASMAELEHEHGALPATVECITPRGGRHLYLIVPSGRPMSGNSAGKLGGGIDTRGQGGYVLCPPSVVCGRPYTWCPDGTDRIADAPEWLLERLDRGGGNGHAASPEEWLELVTSEIAEGEGRNCAVTRLIGLLLRYLPPAHADTAAELVEAWNRTHCKPPLEPKELRTILDSIADREARRRGLP